MTDKMHFHHSLNCLKEVTQQVKHTGQSVNWYKPNITSEEDIIGQQDIHAPILSQFAFGESFKQSINRSVFETLSRKNNTSHVLVLIDSMDSKTGFLDEKLSSIVDIYNPLLNPDTSKNIFNVQGLEKSRLTIRDSGPVLGMLCWNSAELKMCITKHLRKRNFYREYSTMNKRLQSVMVWIERMEPAHFEKCLFSLEKLATSRFITKTKRAMSIPAIKKQFDCNNAMANTISTAYELIPQTPFIASRI